MIKKKLIMTSYLIVALGITACSNSSTNEPNTKTPVEDNTKLDDKTSVDEPDMKNDNTDTVTPEEDNITKYKEIKLVDNEAYNIFLEKKPNSKVEKIALDYDNKAYYYKVEGYDDTNEYEIKIDAVTGNVVKEESEKKDSKNIEITLEHVGKIGNLVSNVIQDAGDDFKSIEWELEIENSKPILEIKVDRENNDIEYTYDLETETLLEKDQ